jgi:hypothetical protein
MAVAGSVIDLSCFYSSVIVDQSSSLCLRETNGQAGRLQRFGAAALCPARDLEEEKHEG